MHSKPRPRIVRACPDQACKPRLPNQLRTRGDPLFWVAQIVFVAGIVLVGPVLAYRKDTIVVGATAGQRPV